ncbi:ATP-binding protein [Halovivax sp.]|uniref:sensor histidine kinase n=1 Tax=Halovivax sp. TaxID=1935978 RepID=UPI0025C215D9|nr:ATP-binding protein [Halovivax sp.]
MTRQPRPPPGGDGTAAEAVGPVAVRLVPSDRDDAASIASGLESASDRIAVDAVEEPDALLGRIASGRVDCVVAAYDLPDRDPLALCADVRETDPDLPFVCYGADVPPADAAVAVGAGGVTAFHRLRDEAGDGSLLAARIEAAVDERRASSALAERARRQETLLGNLPGIVYRCRLADGWPMEYVRGGCEELTGYRANALERGDVVWGTEILHADDRAWTWDAVQKKLESGGSFELTYRIVTREGTAKWVWERGRRIESAAHDEPRIEGFITDVTERRERAEQLQVISHLLRHNLRNDMTVVRGYARMLEAETERFDEEASVILDRIDDLLTTVDKTQPIVDVLTSPRERAVVDVGDALERAVAAIENRHPHAKLDVTDEASASVVAIAELERAVTELIENAVVHSDSERPSVSVDVERRGGTVAVRVADEGPPIPDMELDVLTGDREPEPLFHGTGLGLWLVEWIVRRSGGSLSFERNEPRGNVVTLELARYDGGR